MTLTARTRVRSGNELLKVNTEYTPVIETPLTRRVGLSYNP